MEQSAPIPDDYYADRLRTGDERAFRQVMDRYFLIITHFSLRIVANRAAAEDIAEETFIKLWQGRGKVTNFQSVKAFLFITAKNACLNELRSEKNLARREQVFAGGLGRGGVDRPGDHPGGGVGRDLAGGGWAAGKDAGGLPAGVCGGAAEQGDRESAWAFDQYGESTKGEGGGVVKGKAAGEGPVAGGAGAFGTVGPHKLMNGFCITSVINGY